jgi:hypothetical protein
MHTVTKGPILSCVWSKTRYKVIRATQQNIYGKNKTSKLAIFGSAEIDLDKYLVSFFLVLGKNRSPSRPVRLAYQPPASSTFLSEQTSHQQSANSTLLSEQTSTKHQPPAKRTGCRNVEVPNL